MDNVNEELAAIIRQQEHLIKPGTCRATCKKTGKPCTLAPRAGQEKCWRHCPRPRRKPEPKPDRGEAYYAALEHIVELHIAGCGKRANWFCLVTGILLQHGFKVTYEAGPRPGRVTIRNIRRHIVLGLDTRSESLGAGVALELCLSDLLQTLGYNIDYNSDAWEDAVARVKSKYCS